MSACLFTLVSLFLSLPVCLSYRWLFSHVCLISCVFQSAYLHTCLSVCLSVNLSPCSPSLPSCLLTSTPVCLSHVLFVCWCPVGLPAFLSNVPIASIGPLTSCLECLLPVLVHLPFCLVCLLPVLVHLPSCLMCLLPVLIHLPSCLMPIASIGPLTSCLVCLLPALVHLPSCIMW